ncbi:hypothetical protein ALO54_102376 [Pseudomonas syringae pv. philadelphi]|nr:hypothetical protein ALO86_102120 [Pseudomonas syringae pv. berberidis]KPY26122.1 hypothetical protein ALO54_102376 [Pseudomonas syringae pv. philadelphi]RMM29343.1 hypothetical protein ALQ83_102437 [Pseudomonas syringae pv. berberidis]RMP59256.1 hypothetical protein ALQ19_102426 [Pseudomonas syringae pv. berberidis]RMQ41527.1 hypothetical protein ALQ06_102352 [Pseudomonas syringae pv. berberidis]
MLPEFRQRAELMYLYNPDINNDNLARPVLMVHNGYHDLLMSSLRGCAVA